MSERATFEELLAFANKVREAGGGNPLDALMPSVPQDASQCLIARNLNFNCEVNGDGSGQWCMYIYDDPETVEKIANALELETKVNFQDEAYGIVLPERIAQVAKDFDEAQEIIHDIRWKASGNGLDEPTEEEMRAYFLECDEDSRNLLIEFAPYIEASENEAYTLATVVNPDGSIVV